MDGQTDTAPNVDDGDEKPTLRLIVETMETRVRFQQLINRLLIL